MSTLPVSQRLRTVLVKLFRYLFRSDRAYPPSSHSRTLRLFDFLRALFSARRLRDEDLKDISWRAGKRGTDSSPCLPTFNSSPPPSIAASSTVGCSSSPSSTIAASSAGGSPRSEGRASTMLSIKEEEEELAEEIIVRELPQPVKGYNDNDDGFDPQPVKRVFTGSDPLREEPLPCSPTEAEGEELHIPPGGTTAIPGSHTPRRGQPRIRGTVPSYLQRYDRKIEIPENEDEVEIQTMLSASQFERKPRGVWSLCTHPEGVLYHTAIIDGLRFSTDVNIYDDDTIKELLDFTNHIRHRLRISRRVDTDVKDFEIVFDLSSDGTWEYYIADHKSRHLLWLEKYHIQTDIRGGAESLAHLKHKINFEYYIHLCYFPHGNSLPNNFFNELRGMITWTLSDSLTSLDSLAPYTDQNLERFLVVADRLEDLEKTAPVYAVASGARLWSMFETERYYNYSGAPGARITRDQSVHKSTRKPPSSLSLFLSLLLFHVPSKRLEMLDKLYVDHQVKNVAFKSFATKLVDSWQAEVINSAVLLNANVAYLAIPGILDTPGEITLGVVASLISIVMSLCSVILGLLLTKRLRGLDEKGASEAAGYLNRWWNDKQGLFKLALMFSLPYAMLMWGAISFVVAIIFMAIEQFRFNAPFIILVVVFSIALVTCVWVILQIDSWATFVDGLQFWKWLPHDDIPDEERHFVAQRITRVRKRATARAVTIARESAIIAVRRTSTFFGSVTARPAGERAQPISV